MSTNDTDPSPNHVVEVFELPAGVVIEIQPEPSRG